MTTYLIFVTGLVCGVLSVLAIKLLVVIADEYWYYRNHFRNGKWRALTLAIINL